MSVTFGVRKTILELSFFRPDAKLLLVWTVFSAFRKTPNIKAAANFPQNLIPEEISPDRASSVENHSF